MTTIAKEITRLLNEAATNRNVPPLKEAFLKLKQLVEENNVVVDKQRTYEVPSDLYLYCCETALFLEEWAVAKHCLARLLERTTNTLANNIRCLYCRAMMDAHDAQGLRCQELVEAIHAALAKVLKGMKLALQEPARHSYLVSMGTEHMWNIGRVLYKTGSFEEIVAPIGAVVNALEKIDHSDWKLRATWTLRQITALSGCGRHAEANALLAKATDIIAKNVPGLKYPLYRLQVALSKFVANPKVKADAGRGIMRCLFASQAVLCGLLEGPAAETELLGAFQDIVQEVKADSDPNTKQGKAPPAKKAGDAATPTSQDESTTREECFAELGLALALVGQEEKATEVMERAIHAKPLRARVFGEFTQSLLKAQQCGGMAVQNELHANFCNPHMIQELIAAIRKIDRTLESAVRIVDPSDRNHVVQIGCVLIWNIGLPLLQQDLRHHVARSFQGAAKYLDDIGSNMNQLRTMLHHEAALCDMDSDYLNKASSRVEKALGIDYVMDPEEVKLYALDRPLDRFLVWMKRRLDTKSNLYMKPDNKEDEALLILEQARDAPLMSKLSMLSRAANILVASEPPADYFVEEGAASADAAPTTGKDSKKPPPKKGKTVEAEETAIKADPEAEAKRHHLRVRANLWHTILQLAWKERSPLQIDTVRQAAEHLHGRTWVRKGDRDMRLLQADAAMKVADTYAAWLDSKALRVAQRKFVEDDMVNEDDEEDEEEMPDEIDVNEAREIAEKSGFVSEASEGIQNWLLTAAKIGADLVGQGWNDQWVVMNAVTMLWNYYTDAFSDNDFMSAADGLESLYPILMALNLDPKKETSLLVDAGFAYVRSLLQLYMREKLGLDDSIPNCVHVSGLKIHEFTIVDQVHPKLTQAMEVCEKLIGILPTPMHSIQFCMTGATIRRLQGKPQDQRAHPQHKLMVILEQFTHPGVPEAEKHNLLAQAFTLLQQDPNMQLVARLAERSLAIPGSEKTTVRITSLGQQLYDEGKLGWRQNDIAAAPTGKEGKSAKSEKGKGAAAAEPVAEPPELPNPSAADWLWYSLMLQYQGLGIAELINPSVQDKPTQYEIRRQALVSLTNSALAALQATPQFRTATIMKALRHYYRLCKEFAVDASTRAFAFPSLKQLLSQRVIHHVTIANTRQQAGAKHGDNDGDVMSFLCLFLLRCTRDQNLAEEGMTAMKMAIKLLPASYHKPFWDLDVQLRCEAGMPTNQTLLRVKEYSPETQAQVWVALARFAKSHADQQFAFQSAVDVLQGKPAEQAEYMLAMVQWMLQSNANATLGTVRTMALSAVDLISDFIDAEVDEDAPFTDVGSVAAKSRVTGMTMQSIARRSSAGSMASDMRRSTVAGTHRSASSQRPRRDRPRTTVKQLRLAIQAYYLLAKVGTSGSVCDGLPVDPRSCLEMVVHYTMRLWSVTVTTVNAHHAKAKARQEKAEGRNRMMSRSANSQPNAAAAAAATTAADDKKKGTKGNTTAPVEPPKEEKKAIPGPISIPTTLQGWFGFEVPSVLPEALRDMRTQHALCPGTLDSPDAFISVLSDVVDLLHHEGLDIQAQSVLSMMSLCISVFFPSSSAVSEAGSRAMIMKSWELMESVGCGAMCAVARITNPQTSAQDRAALMEDAQMTAQHHAAKAQRGPKQRVNIQDSAQRHIHRYWTSMCEVMLREGRVSSARVILQEAALHAKAYADVDYQVRCEYLRARIQALEGHPEDALDTVRSAQNLQQGGSSSAAKWVDMKLFEMQLLLQLQRFEEAFTAEGNAQYTLQQQAVGCSNIHLEMVELSVPHLQATIAIRFSEQVVRIVHQSARFGASTAAQLHRGLVHLIDQAVERAERSNSRASGILLQLELTKIERGLDDDAASNEDAKSVQQTLRTESNLLEEALQDVQSKLSHYTGAISSQHTDLRCSVRKQLSRVLMAIGSNLLRRVDVNNELLDAFRGSNVTQLAFPVNEEAAPALEAEVVTFMRSSRKQRDAANRIKKRATVKAEINERRSAARAEKQADIERRREQKKLEEASAPPKKDPKAKRTTVAGDLAELQDVDPADKCGIDSPDESEDDGVGEDSHSEEEEEHIMAAGNNDADGVTLAHIHHAFSVAAEYTTPLTHANTEAKLGQAMALWRQFEAIAIGYEQRQAMLKGEKPPSSLRSATLEEKWTQLAEVPALEEEKKPGKKDDPKKKGQTPPLATPEPVAPAPVLPGVLPPQLQEVHRLLEECIQTAHSQMDDFALQASLYLLHAKCSMATNLPLATARAIEASQCCRTAQHVVELWEQLAFSDAQEMVAWRALVDVRENSPEMVGSPHYAAILKGLLSTSKMFNRLRVPDASAAFNCGNGVDDIPAPISTDTCTLTIVPEGDDLMAVFRRPTGHVHLQRQKFNPLQARELERKLRNFFDQRTTALSGDATDDILEQQYARSILQGTEELLGPLLEQLSPVMEHFGPKCHLILCIDAGSPISALPIDNIAPLSTFRSVSRELSVFSAAQKLNKRAGDKYSAANATVILDAHHEHAALHKVAFDDKPKPAGWSVATCTVDENGFDRPLAVSHLQKLISGANSTVVVASCGRFANTVPLPNICTLSLDHIRFWGMLDRVCTKASVRRENQANMSKTPTVQWCESSWNVALLLLARGVECLMAHHGATSPQFGESMTKLVFQNMEKAQPKHFGELAQFHLRHEASATEEPNVSLKKEKGGAAPVDGDAYRLWGSPPSERNGLAIFGICPDESTAASKNK